MEDDIYESLIIYNGVKYVQLMNDNSYKSKSLEDNVYFTLRDIFMSGSSDDCTTVNYFNAILTNNISFEERTPSFTYANVLREPKTIFVKSLYNYLKSMTKDGLFYDFAIIDIEPGLLQNADYIVYDVWWAQFEEMRTQIKQLVKD